MGVDLEGSNGPETGCIHVHYWASARSAAGVAGDELAVDGPITLAEVVRRALAGGPVDDALVRVASTGALERSRDVALDYARQARELLRDEPRLEALTHIVIERKS